MRPGTPQFVAARLVEAREAREMTATVLADLVGVSRTAISQYENGHQTPSPENMRRIAESLGVPLARFLRPTRTTDQPTVFWRSMNSATKAARTRAFRRYGWLVEIVDFLRQHVELPAVDFPRFDVPADPTGLSDRDIDNLAERTRRHWGLGDGPISNVAWLLENHGAIVVRQDLGAEKLDAFSVWSDADPAPVFVLGSGKGSAARSIFDAAHELGHIVMHRGLAPLYLRKTDTFAHLEKQAHRFAGAFLLPERTFSSDLCLTSLDAFRSIKPKWRASIAAMIMRASHLGLITDEAERRLWMSYSRKGWRKQEPLDDVVQPEAPRVLRRAFDLLLEGKVISPSEIEANISVRISDIENLLGLPPGYLGQSEVVSLKFPKPSSALPAENPAGAVSESLDTYRLPYDRQG